MMLTKTMRWIIRATGTMASVWGVGMLIANRSAPDPVHPAGLVLVLLAGGLLLWVGYAGGAAQRAAKRGDRG